ncbi:hypothetical protein PQX77_004297 [Marasmius sp. AFHP31]|nr:hypothetical protein PQX77_004297 [Marasmius sp. AFHP31]
MAYTVSHASNASHRQSVHTDVGISPQALVKRPASDAASLAPGIHLIPTIQSSPFRQMTPQEVMTAFVPRVQSPTSNAMRRVQYLDRSPEYQGRSMVEPVVFSVHGDPGPYLSQLVAERVSVDDSSDLVFARWGNPRIDIALDFPGIVLKRRLPRGLFTRQDLAKELALQVLTLINDGRHELKGSVLPRSRKFLQNLGSGKERWRWDQINTGRLRLISANLYGRYWVPILAIDVV